MKSKENVYLYKILRFKNINNIKKKETLHPNPDATKTSPNK